MRGETVQVPCISFQRRCIYFPNVYLRKTPEAPYLFLLQGSPARAVPCWDPAPACAFPGSCGAEQCKPMAVPFLQEMSLMLQALENGNTQIVREVRNNPGILWSNEHLPGSYRSSFV